MGLFTLRFNDADRALERRLDDYVRKTGVRKGAAIKALVTLGLQEHERGALDVRELIPALYDKLATVHENTGASREAGKIVMLNILETVMLLRQLVASADKKLLADAQRNALATYEKLQKEGTL